MSSNIQIAVRDLGKVGFGFIGIRSFCKIYIYNLICNFIYIYIYTCIHIYVYYIYQCIYVYYIYTYTYNIYIYTNINIWYQYIIYNNKYNTIQDLIAEESFCIIPRCS